MRKSYGILLSRVNFESLFKIIPRVPDRHSVSLFKNACDKRQRKARTRIFPEFGILTHSVSFLKITGEHASEHVGISSTRISVARASHITPARETPLDFCLIHKLGRKRIIEATAPPLAFKGNSRTLSPESRNRKPRRIKAIRKERKFSEQPRLHVVSDRMSQLMIKD